ncbi:vWA domain-containing protein [Pleionea sediminis]|uniref:vWA domain-containing protein n=1 Tax=Pleionea sediminis TaxID=2569479 RepID=UPI0011858A6A|nr:vWA domain-containing protein [Pleionea sediminis]
MSNALKGAVVFAGVIIGGYVLFNSNNSSTTKRSDSVSSNKVNVADTYGNKGALNSWPKLGEQTNLADNLLAKNYYIVFDGSGSMGDYACEGAGAKIDIAKKAISAFIDEIQPSDNVGLLAFDRKGNKERVALSVQNRPSLKQAVQSVEASGGTPLRTSITEAYAALTSRAKQQMGYGEYHLVIVTDGEASSGERPDEIVSKIVKQSPVQIHTVGFCIDQTHSLNQRGIVNYRSANSAETLVKSLQTVLAEAESFDISEFDG